MVPSGYRELIVVRHAKTEQEAASDRLRRLTDRGRRDARTAGRWLADNDKVPDVVLASPAVRAAETAQLVAAELDPAPEVVTVEELYGASVDEAVEVLASRVDDVRRVLLVGHNPTMSQLAYDIQQAPTQPWGGQLPTAGTAAFAFAGSWPDLRLGTADLVAWNVPRG